MSSALDKDDIPDLTFDELIERIRMSKVNSDEYLGIVLELEKELALREPTYKYSCKNCGHTTYEEHKLRAPVEALVLSLTGKQKNIV